MMWSAGGGGALTQITDVLLAAPAASIDIQNIPATDLHLLLVLSLRTDRPSADDGVWIRMNNDSAANYTYQRTFANNSLMAVTENDAVAQILAGECPAANGTASRFGAGDIWIPDYASATKHKTIVSRLGSMATGAAGDKSTTQGAGTWANTAAINRLTLLPQIGGNFVTGSRATLYRMR